MKTPWDSYKVNVIEGEMKKAAKDEFYIVRLRGDSGKAINMDTNALRLLKAYYEGRITPQQIEDICGKMEGV